MASKKKGKKKEKTKEERRFKEEVLDRMLKLSTSGFGLVAALAWNELIKALVTDYIRPFFGEGSGLISLFIYAVLITVLAVAVTYNLTKLTGKEEN